MKLKYILLTIFTVVLIGFGGEMIQKESNELDIPYLELNNNSLNDMFDTWEHVHIHTNLLTSDALWEQGRFNFIDNLFTSTSNIRTIDSDLVQVNYGINYVFSIIGDYEFYINELDINGNLVNNYGEILIDSVYTPTNIDVTQLRISLNHDNNSTIVPIDLINEIGRASCRERV